MRVLIILLLCISVITMQACSKKEAAYDPSGKCGSVLSSTISSSLPTVWNIKVSMDDGHIYNTVSSTSYSLGARVCF